jgi:hypothetical protein
LEGVSTGRLAFAVSPNSLSYKEIRISMQGLPCPLTNPPFYGILSILPFKKWGLRCLCGVKQHENPDDYGSFYTRNTDSGFYSCIEAGRYFPFPGKACFFMRWQRSGCRPGDSKRDIRSLLLYIRWNYEDKKAVASDL